MTEHVPTALPNFVFWPKVQTPLQSSLQLGQTTGGESVWFWCGLADVPGTELLAQMLRRLGFRIPTAGKRSSRSTTHLHFCLVDCTPSQQQQRRRCLIRNCSSCAYPRPPFCWYDPSGHPDDVFVGVPSPKPSTTGFRSWLPNFRWYPEFSFETYSSGSSRSSGGILGSLLPSPLPVTKIHLRPLCVLRHSTDLAAVARRKNGGDFHLVLASSRQQEWITMQVNRKGCYVRYIHDLPVESEYSTTVVVAGRDKRKGAHKKFVQSYGSLSDEKLMANIFAGGIHFGGESNRQVDPLNSTGIMMQKLKKVWLSGNFVARLLNSQREWTSALMFFQWAAQQEGYKHSAHIYRLMIHRLSNIPRSDKSPRNVETLLNLAQEMIEKCWDPGLSTSNVVVSELCRIGRVSSALQFVQTLKKNCFPINTRTYNLLVAGLQSFSRTNPIIDWEETWELYHEMQQKQTGRNCRPNIVTFGILTRGLFRAGKLDEAILLLMSMKLKHRCRPDVVIYSTLLTALTKMDRLHDACKVFEALERAGHKPDVIAFSSLITGLCNAGRLAEAFLLFNKMVRQGCKPDFVICNSVLSAYARAGQVDAAINLFEEMKQIFAMRPPLLRTDCIIVALFSAGRIEDAMKFYYENDHISLLEHQRAATTPGVGHSTAHAAVLRELCRAGHLHTAFVILCTLHGIGTIPSASIYMTVVGHFVKAGEWRKAAKLKEDMSQQYGAPGPGFYNGLIAGLGRAGELNDASQLFKRMEQGGFGLNLFMYNCGINWLGKAGKFLDASRMLEDMETRNISADVVTYNSLLHHAGDLCSVDKLQDIYEQMITKGCNPNVVTYSILMDAMGSSGRPEEVWVWMRQMKEKGCAPDSHTYNVLMKSLLKCGPSRQASRLLKSMDRVGCPADVITYNLLIAGLGRRGQIGKAHNIFEQMKAKGIVPDEITHSSLITQLGRAGQWMVALKHFRLLQRQHCSCDVVVFNSIINVLGKEGRLVEALDTITLMEKQGYVPDVVTYNSIIAGFCRRGQAEEAIHFFVKMQQKRCAPDLITYSTLLRGLLKMEQYVTAVQLLEQMVGTGQRIDLAFYHSLKRRLPKEPNSDKILRLLNLLLQTR